MVKKAFANLPNHFLHFNYLCSMYLHRCHGCLPFVYIQCVIECLSFSSQVRRIHYYKLDFKPVLLVLGRTDLGPMAVRNVLKGSLEGPRVLFYNYVFYPKPAFAKSKVLMFQDI